LRRAAVLPLLLFCALGVRAQPQPDTTPPPPPQDASPAQTTPAEPPADEAAAPAAEPRPAPKAALPKPAVKPAAAPLPQEDPRDADLAALHAQVARLQSALDAERAAALPPPEEAAAAPRTAGTALWWVALALVLGLGCGFALGWRMLDRRVRRRYGGLRIY
jgi:uncharacterized protein HemX